MNESNQSISKIANHTVAEAIVPVEVMFRLIFLVIAHSSFSRHQSETKPSAQLSTADNQTISQQPPIDQK
jgi:hypothetical protein